MPLPEMSSLQCLVVHLLFSGRHSSRELCAKLNAAGQPIDQPGVSRLLQRMEFAGYVQVGYATCERGGRTVRESSVGVTDLGVGVWRQMRDYYVNMSLPPPDLQPIATKEGKYASLPRRQRKGILLRQTQKEMKELAAEILG